MTNHIKLYSFGDVDRSGKVRWTACELGYEIEERRIELGEHKGAAYRELNPYAQVPTAIVGGETWIESTAICLMLAEKHPQAHLVPSETVRRNRFWQQVNLLSASLEFPVVCYYLGSRGVIDGRWPELVGESTGMRMREFASRLPDDGYLCGDFSLADICAGYVLRVAVQGKLLPYTGRQAGYMDRLRARPAAIASRVFDSLEA